MVTSLGWSLTLTHHPRRNKHHRDCDRHQSERGTSVFTNPRTRTAQTALAEIYASPGVGRRALVAVSVVTGSIREWTGASRYRIE